MRVLLKGAPRLVVGPVGVGFGQDDLVAWARLDGREVVREPVDAERGRLLLLCERRSQLAQIPRNVPLAEILVLDEAVARLDLSGWRAGLGEAAEEFATATFEQTEGWPAGLALALRVHELGAGGHIPPLHQHPLAAVVLERLLPENETREQLCRAAATPLLLAELSEPLGLEAAQVDDLLDLGYLTHVQGGLTLPRLLRRYLLPRPEPAVALAVAHILAGSRRLEEALLTLAEAGLWEDYLDLLAEGFEAHAQDGEVRLRKALRQLPSRLHDRAGYRYLMGSLERLRGELERAQQHYATARRKAGGELRARIDNARGIAFALAGDMEAARKAFGWAVRVANSNRLEGEARHNRAGVSIQQGRFAEAEQDLREAVARFREGGDYVREARSLQLLALSWHRRGLLVEARKGYEDALELLGTLGQPTTLLRTNLAEVFLLMGMAADAKAQLDQAASEATRSDARAAAYVEANVADWLLNQGRIEAAVRKLEALLRRDGLEALLRAEAELLLARALRQQGRLEEALKRAGAASAAGVAATLEQALCRNEGLDEVVEHARMEEARFELATALLHRGKQEDLAEALELIRTHGYRSLLDAPEFAPSLAALAQDDPAALDLFPLRMSTFGGFRLRFLGHTLTLAEFPTRKSAALLLRLALAGRPLPREVVAEEFWSDASNPVHSLQTALYHLNRTLRAQAVRGRKGTLELLYPVELDLVKFESAAVEALDGSWTRDSDTVRKALELASGEPLAEFPEWFEDEKRQAESLSLRLWRRLAELEASQPLRAAEALEELLKLDPYDVDSRRHLIGIYSGIGEAELARRQEERLKLLEGDL